VIDQQPVASGGGPRDSTYDVRIWAVKKIPSTRTGGRRAATYRLRWVVAGKVKSANFTTVALAESRRAELLAAARRGEAFDVATGLPVSASRPAPVEQVTQSWWDWAITYADLKWPTLAPHSRLSLAEALTTITIAVAVEDASRPAAAELRRAMMQWAFITVRRAKGEPPHDLIGPLTWLSRHTLSLRDVADPVRLRVVLDALARKLDATPAAPSTVARKRAVLFNALDIAVERGLLDSNPLTSIRWSPPKIAVAVDPACVVNPDQARSLLAAVAQVGGISDAPAPKKGARGKRRAPTTEVQRKVPAGGPLVAFFGCLYYAGLRPGEALALLETDLELPEAEDTWGVLRVARNDPEITTTWTDSGRREARQLKHRARGEVRPVPCYPPLVALLRQHLATYGTGPDGGLFRGARGGVIKESVYTEVWQAARRRTLTPAQVASPLVKRPYDLRHSCVSTWLAAGVEPTQIAEWVGHSVAVLLRVYAHVLPGRDEIAKQRIDALLQHKA